ncbi:MAG: NUDIX domain-containing protein [Chloroflexi bacterium]|nr:NUDIX domain-containing protein [Chloroflexota bacterium]
MAKFEYGEYIGKTAKLIPSVTALIRDSEGRVLLTRRTDNGRWCLPGGAMDAGESAEEACRREVMEETGLDVCVRRLVGVYSTPHRVTVYADGNRVQYVSLMFEVEPVGGTLGLSDETTEAGYFSLDEIRGMDVIDPHLERIADTLAAGLRAIIK